MRNFLKRFILVLGAMLLAGNLSAATVSYSGTVALPDCYSSINSNTVACTNFSASVIPLLPRCDLAIIPTIVGTTNGNATTLSYFSTSNVVFSIDLSYDGGLTYTKTVGVGNSPASAVINVPVAPPLSGTLALNGTNPVTGRFWFAITNMLGATHAKITGVTTTSTNGATISGVGYSVTGPSL